MWAKIGIENNSRPKKKKAVKKENSTERYSQTPEKWNFSKYQYYIFPSTPAYMEYD